MTWVDIAAARAAADQPLDAGLTHAIHARLDQIYTQSGYDIVVGADGTYGPGSDLLGGPTATTSWALSSQVQCPIPARTQAGGSPRQIEVSAEVQCSDSLLTAVFRVYLLGYAISPTVDGTDGVVDETAYAELNVTGTTAWTADSAIVTPTLATALDGDGSVPGLSVPVYYVRVIYKVKTGTATVGLRLLRFREVIS